MQHCCSSSSKKTKMIYSNFLTCKRPHHEIDPMLIVNPKKVFNQVDKEGQNGLNVALHWLGGRIGQSAAFVMAKY